MAPVDDRTTVLDLAKPSPLNDLEDDVLRLRDFADDVDLALSLRPLAADVTAAIGAAVAGKADASALIGYVPTARTVAGGAGLDGGGALSGNITISLSSITLASLALADTAVQSTRQIFTAAGLDGGGDLTMNRTIAPVWSDQSQAEAGAATNVILNPLRGLQLVAAARPWASQVVAESGTALDQVMSPGRTKQLIDKLPPGVPVIAKAAAALVAGDNGYCISSSSGAWIVNTGLPAGTAISLFNNSASSRSITQGASVTMRLLGTATTGSKSLAGYGFATLVHFGSEVWGISGPGVS